MSILTELNRIENAKNSLVNTAKNWGLITEAEADGIKIETVAAEYAGVTAHTSTDIADVTVGVQDSYTVDAGYYSDSFTVANAIQSVIEQGNVELEEGKAKTFSAGYYPNAFAVTATSGEIRPEETPGTATAGEILVGETAWVNGVQITGAMPNNGNVNITLTNTNRYYDIPEGYHAGSGIVGVAGNFIGSNITQYDSEDGNIVLSPSNTSQAIAAGYYVEGGNSASVLVDSDPVKTITPSKTTQIVSGVDSDGNDAFITSVTVNPIPDKYQDISGVTATADKVLTGSKFVNSSGVSTNGTMPNIGNVSVTLTTDDSSYTVPTGYHAGGGAIGVASAAGTYTIKATDLANTNIVIAPASAGAPAPNYYLTGVTVNTSEIEARLALI